MAASAARGNSGLSTAVTLSNQYATVAAGVPLPTTPAFLTERTLAEQMALSATSVLWGIDPNIMAPHVHQVSLGIQREIGWATAVEARYVGTFGRDIWRGTDFNQMQITPGVPGGLHPRPLERLPGAAGGPRASARSSIAAVPGSQPLTILPNFGAGRSPMPPR